MEVKETVCRPGGWLAGAAAFGLIAALMSRLVTCPLGWAGAFLGFLPAALLPRVTLTPRWEHALRLLRCLWALEAMALSLYQCTQGLTNYSYAEWSAWVPALLLLLLAWRGCTLTRRGLERAGKLMLWLLGAMAAVLFGLTLPRMHLSRLAVSGWSDVWEAVRLFLLTAGAASALVPAGGKWPTLTAAGIGSAGAALTTASEGVALAGMMSYPFLNLCDAAVFELRLSPFGSAMWALSEAALLIHLLSWFPGRKGVAALACAAVLGLTFTLPWGSFAVLVFLISGAILGYLPVLWGMMHRHFTGESYI